MNARHLIQQTRLLNSLEGFLVRRVRKKLRCTQVKPNASALRNLYIDISVISSHDAGTGIQRVVRAISLNLLHENVPGWVVQPVTGTRKHGYMVSTWPSQPVNTQCQIHAGSGDVFLGLDFSLDAICRHRKQLTSLKQQGVQLWFLMYDLLPVQRAEWFSDQLVARYKKWLYIISGLATGFFCISPIVANDLKIHLSKKYSVPASDMPEFEVLPMGYDLLKAPHGVGVSQDLSSVLDKIAQAPTALMVGTLEPRKGHEDVIKAFERLWEDGERLNLVIVGRPGWKTEALQQHLREHQLRDQNIFWIDNATDGEVEALYKACNGVIVASLAEGFGLPLIEGLAYGKRVLARDIPVFKTRNLQGVSYFSTNADETGLAITIKNWLLDEDQSQIVFDRKVHATWAESADYLISILSKS